MICCRDDRIVSGLLIIIFNFPVSTRVYTRNTTVENSKLGDFRFIIERGPFVTRTRADPTRPMTARIARKSEKEKSKPVSFTCAPHNPSADIRPR